MRRLLLLFLGAGTLAAEPVAYEIRPAAGSRFALEVAKTGLLSGKKHLFLFERYHGTLHYDAEAPGKSRVEMTVEAASLSCQDTWIKPQDVRKVMETALGDMLAADRFPELKFESGAVAPRPDGRFDVSGTLTIRGLARPVRVTVALAPQPGGSLKFTGAAEVRLKDYGLKPPSAAWGAVGTKNEMAVEFAVVAARK